jgi:hypothetical protein
MLLLGYHVVRGDFNGLAGRLIPLVVQSGAATSVLASAETPPSSGISFLLLHVLISVVVIVFHLQLYCVRECKGHLL